MFHLDTTKIVADSVSFEKPIITVVPNYRLNLFGFGDGKGSGEINLSLKDQALAIDWVRKHISGFGGDPVSDTSSELNYIFNYISLSGKYYPLWRKRGGRLCPCSLDHRPTCAPSHSDVWLFVSDLSNAPFPRKGNATSL